MLDRNAVGHTCAGTARARMNCSTRILMSGREEGRARGRGRGISFARRAGQLCVSALCAFGSALRPQTGALLVSEAVEQSCRLRRIMTKSAIAVRGESDVAFASAGSEEDLVQRATALIPTLRGRCDETEERRSLTLETRRDLMESGVHRIFQPRRFGGVEGSMRAGVDILIETGRGCASTAQGPELRSARRYAASCCWRPCWPAWRRRRSGS